MKNTPFIVSAIAGLALVALVFGGTGFYVAWKKVWPYHQLMESKRILISLIRHGEVVAAYRQSRAPEGAAREPVFVHDTDAAMGSGHYAMLGWDDRYGSYAIRLYSGASGTLEHTWPIDEMAYDPRAEHRQNAPHAMEVLADGTALVSFDWLGLMARLEPCGDAIWSKQGFYHHSFSPAADGDIWTWYGEKTGYGQVQDIVKLDPETGEVNTRISLENDLVKRSEESALVFSMFTDFPFVPDDENPRDIFHPNDVEELQPEMAAAFPQFEAGDLMLSIRELDMVMVISPVGEIKWYQQGPWLKQHDPDFEPDGRISVYDNSRHRPRSMIMTIDPQTREVTNALPGFEGTFKSAYRGKHQRLPNGNRLVTIPEQGQALEIASDGRLIVEFNNIVPGLPEWNDDLVNAKWYPDGYFDQLPSCTAN